MSTRERIIVGLMLLTVVYGVYTLFLSSPQKAETASSAKEPEALNRFIAKIADNTKIGIPKKQAYILQKAQTDWKQDPLIEIQPKKDVTQEKEPQPYVLKSKILYTGFLQMGPKRLAIINGMEYEIGDNLEPGGFLIRSILPNHVVIAPANEKRKTIIIPMEEIE